MIRLCENIEDINIIGGIDQLSEVVSKMDIVMQNIANDTGELTDYLIRYSSSNKGLQYEKVVNTSLQLNEEIKNAAEGLNVLQNDIVEYQNKIYRYEDMTQSASTKNQYQVNMRHFDVDVTAVQFNRSDMLDVAASLKNYGDLVWENIVLIDQEKEDIANVWRDSQYYDFAEFIDEIKNKVEEALEVFDDYVIYLEEKIKELD